MDTFEETNLEAEVDSDVNDDPGRELQLDDSFADWYRNVEYWVEQSRNITRVPKGSAFEAAEEVDAEE